MPGPTEDPAEEAVRQAAEKAAAEEAAKQGNFTPGAGGAAGREAVPEGSPTAPALETAEPQQSMSEGTGTQSAAGVPQTRPTSINSQARGEANKALASGAVPTNQDWLNNPGNFMGSTAGASGPKGWHPSSEKVEVETQGGPMSPESAAALGEAFQMQQLGEVQKARAATAANDEIAKLNSQVATSNRQFSNDEETRYKRRAGIVQQFNTELGGIIKDIEGQKGKLDPARLWHEASFGKKMLGFLAAIASGAAAGLAGRPDENFFISNLRANMKADYDKQLQGINTTGEQYERKNNALGAFMKMTGDLQSARAALNASKLGAIKAEIEKRLASKDSALQRANLISALGKVKEEQAKWLIEYEKGISGKTKRTMEMKYATGGGGGGVSKADMPTWMSADFDKIDDRLQKSGYDELGDIFSSSVEALKMPKDLEAKAYTFMRKGDYSRAGEIMADYFQKNPQAQQNWGNARAVFKHKLAGANVTPGERGDVESAMNDQSPAGVQVFTNIVGKQMKRRKAEAYKKVNRKSAVAYELNSRYFDENLNAPPGTPAPVPAGR